MTWANRTVDNGSLSDIGVAVDTVDLGAGASDAAAVKVLDGTASGTVPLRVRVDPPGAADGGAVVRQAPIDVFVCSFADVGSSLMTADLTQRRLGTGVGVTQGSGNLLVTTGTSTNAEFLARSIRSFNGALIARAQTLLSQRIANQNFAVLLADRIGEGLSCTINSATSISVTLTAHGFTAANVGQFMFAGAISGAAGVPGRYAIASIPDANTINFTVAGWPASGSCTLDLFGWNHYKLLYNGTTATAALFDAQRRGWASGDTTLTISTTASPGHIAHLSNDGRNAYVADMLAATSTTPTITTRGSRYANMPDPEVELYLYLWSYNGTTAPASTTTWTVGFVSVEDTTNNVVYLGGVRQQGQAAPFPVSVVGTPAVTMTSTTLTAVTTGTAAANLGKAEDAVAASGDTGVAVWAVRRDAPATNVSAAGDYAELAVNAVGAMWQQPTFAPGTGATPAQIISAATTNATSVKASAGTLTSLSATNNAASWRYLKVHNTASAPTAGSGVVLTYGIPPGGGITLTFPSGIAFGTGIGVTITGGIAAADATAIGASEVAVSLSYH